MALHPDFPKSPHEILNPEIRWYPGDELIREKGGLKTLLPPLVHDLRIRVKEWRDNNYKGASETSKALLKHWFETEHLMPSHDGAMVSFRYYFAQREAVETIIYLHDVIQVKDKYDLMRFDSSGAVSAGMFDETWKRFVVKMATGSGKTKVLSLVLAWSYFHKLYEENSDLSRNFLLITPNIIVLDRIKDDFGGLKIFFEDPVLPENGLEGRNWRDDFQLTLHLQDEVNVVRKYGNIFLTNIHRVFDSNHKEPSFNDTDTSEYFLGSKPVTKTTDSRIDLGDIVRDVDELMVLNDEAHHVHDQSLAWFKSIQDIHNRLLQKDSCLSMQIDVTATPRHKNGAIFVQTIVDYPLVEAIYQDVVKHPVLPDFASRRKLNEKKSAKFSERYEDYIHLGYLEWKKVYDEHQKVGKKPVLFLMTDDTRNCDELADYIESTYPEFKESVLVIHTKNNGEIAEVQSGKKKEELESLRKEANEIDYNKYKAIVSVLMLKEGWDVKNVTTIVGLRAFGGGKGNYILPEQTLGRGLRRMYREQDVSEFVSVVGTEPFMDFVESIKDEGVELERNAMGQGTKPKSPLIVEVDNENMKKDIDKLDIQIPVLTPRIQREYKNLSELDASKFKHKKVNIVTFNDEEKREIVFKNIVLKEQETEYEVHHKTVIDGTNVIDYQSVVGYFTHLIMKELRLVSGYDVLYPRVREFIKLYLFEKEVDLEDMNVLRNLSEIEPGKTLIQTFKRHINELTILDKGEAEIKEDYIKLSNCRPFITKDQAYIIPKKSVFNKIIGDSNLELEFASFLENCDDIISYAKNYLAVHFNIDYKNADGEISNYYPDFIVKKSETEVYVVETKGLEDLDAPLKAERLKLWCEDINNAQNKIKYDFVFVDEGDFHKYNPQTFQELIVNFTKYKE
ncbi:MAG: DEAD/DEAH box helicase family protein [Candidatus Methanoperedens sp.]|nr:DEAD/DEAH box helicase family protein [Candidatus Methanoperedens sp.]